MRQQRGGLINQRCLKPILRRKAPLHLMKEKTRHGTRCSGFTDHERQDCCRIYRTCVVGGEPNWEALDFIVSTQRRNDVSTVADRIVIRQDGRIVAEHPRSFGRGETTYDPWHYVPVLARKPGALRNGAPFKDWALPAAIERVRRKLAGADDGNRQMVDILNAVLTDGLPAVEAACAEAITHGVHSADSFSISWPASVILRRRPTSSPRLH
jgi:hypothetical protein